MFARGQDGRACAEGGGEASGGCCERYLKSTTMVLTVARTPVSTSMVTM